MFTSTKTFNNFPCAHRQHKHNGHCAWVHGYSRSFHFWFACEQLTETHFVIDFGDLKEIKAFLEDHFDHTLLLNADDPLIEDFRALEKKGAAKLVLLPNVGMETTAEFVWMYCNGFLLRKTTGRAWCYKVEVRENDKNSGIYENNPTWARVSKRI